ncbi:MAG: GH25 family lysozyme [Luteolibacter sp.]
MRFSLLFLSLAALALPHCSGGYGKMALQKAPKIVNVSAYDPKEKQRQGDSYSQHDVSALRRNGAHGLIARCGKGKLLDEKCADFLSSSHRQGMKLGTYYFVLAGVDPVWQADQYLARLQQISAERGLHGQKILLVGDVDTKSSARDVVAFIDRIHSRTGVYPVIYLENSDRLRHTLNQATADQKRTMRKCPYWIALYRPTGAYRTPKDLMAAYNVWDDWAMWQYAGVEWERRSVSKHYHAGPWRSPEFFGTMDRPLEHNAFNGDVDDLGSFWNKHSWIPN